MKNFIHHLAYKFSKNPIAIFLVRPFWRLYDKHKFLAQIKSIRRNGLPFLRTLYAKAQDSNVEFWLEFGTLLGAIREGGFISHDFDIDLAAWLKDRDKIIQLMHSCGAKRVKRFVSDQLETAYEETYSYRGILIDVFYFTRTGDTIKCNTFGAFDGELKDSYRNSDGWLVKEVTLKYSPLTEATFCDIKLPVPTNAHDNLVAHYGKNYMLPDPNYDYKKVATNVHHYPKEVCTGKLYIG